MPIAAACTLKSARANFFGNLRVRGHLDQPSRRACGRFASLSARSLGAKACVSAQLRAQQVALWSNFFRKRRCDQRAHVGVYNGLYCYRPPAGTRPVGIDRGELLRAARFVRRTCASWLLWRSVLSLLSMLLPLRLPCLPLLRRVFLVRLLPPLWRLRRLPTKRCL